LLTGKAVCSSLPNGLMSDAGCWIRRSLCLISQRRNHVAPEGVDLADEVAEGFVPEAHYRMLQTGLAQRPKLVDHRRRALTHINRHPYAHGYRSAGAHLADALHLLGVIPCRFGQIGMIAIAECC